MVQLMQKFVPRSCVQNFRNECTRSTPLDPKLLFASVVFGCIWDRSVALRYSVENGTNYCNKCKSSSHKVVQNFLQQIHPIHSMFWGISLCLGALGTISLLHETRCKMVEVVQLIQKFMPRSRVRCFHNERTQSTPLVLKLIYCRVSQCLGAFGTILLLHETRCKMS